jgi:hypothetical protein
VRVSGWDSGIEGKSSDERADSGERHRRREPRRGIRRAFESAARDADSGVAAEAGRDVEGGEGAVEHSTGDKDAGGGLRLHAQIQSTVRARPQPRHGPTVYRRG